MVIDRLPGETEAAWRASLDFIGQIGFSHLHIGMTAGLDSGLRRVFILPDMLR